MFSSQDLKLQSWKKSLRDMKCYITLKYTFQIESVIILPFIAAGVWLSFCCLVFEKFFLLFGFI